MLLPQSTSIYQRAQNSIITFGAGLSIWLVYRILTWRVNFHRENELMAGDAPPFWKIEYWPADQINALVSGIFSDLFFMTIAALVLGFVFKSWLRQLVLFALILFLAANIEHIKYNFSNIRFEMLGLGMSPTFISGSITPELIKYIIYMSSVALAALLVLKWKISRWLMSGIWLVSFSTGLYAKPTPALYMPDWSYKNIFMPEISSSNVLEEKREIADDAFKIHPHSMPENPTYNLMIIFVEGLSASSIERGNMQNLSKLSRQGINFENFVGRQIVTANGLYATFTGDTPSFLHKRAVKWDSMTDESPAVKASLPRLLREKNYQTFFLQSADLEFMEKREHLTTLGFETILGDKDWKKAYSRNGWGVDDKTLYENGLKSIDQINPDKPWLMSFLTTTTHAPYNVPGIESPTRRQALNYADQAVGEMVAGLEKRGLLDKTVVIITSDEGREVEGRNGFLNDLALNHQPLIILHPTIKNISIKDYMMNTDLRNLAISLLDENNQVEVRQSVPEHEDIIFGNSITGKFFWYNQPNKSLTACWIHSFYCQEWKDRDTLFKSTEDKGREISIPTLQTQLSRDLEK